MSFTRDADGIAKKGKTQGNLIGMNGPVVMGRNGGKKMLALHL